MTRITTMRTISGEALEAMARRLLSRATVALFASLIAPIHLGAAPPPLTFNLQTAKPQYTKGEKIELQLSITLASSATSPVTVCKRYLGTIHVAQVTSAGRRIKPVRRAVFFETGQATLLAEDLATLNPGDSVTIPYEVPRALDGTPELRDVKLAKGVAKPNTADTYILTVPGTYVIRLSYRYPGDASGGTNVFKGDLLSNSVTIALVN